MDKRANDKLVRSLEGVEEDRIHKKSSLKNWKGREEGEDPG